MGRRHIALGFAGALAMIATTAGAVEISQCVIEVHQAIFLNGPCNFENGSDGSFTLGVANAPDQAAPYFAYVSVEGDSAIGFWNGFPPENLAHEPLGEMKRDGACWANDTARVCAFR